jgi:hypothetical protein
MESVIASPAVAFATNLRPEGRVNPDSMLPQ